MFYAYTEEYKHNDCFLKTKPTFTTCKLNFRKLQCLWGMELQGIQGMELQEKKHKKNTGYRKFVSKEPTFKRCLLILDLKPLRS